MKWKYSKLRFYILNAKWNYRFWLFAEKIYRMHSFYVNNKDFNLNDVDDFTGKMKHKVTKKTRRRFIGYMYKGMMYLDNPGFRHTVDKDSWKAWEAKGLIS